MRQIWISPILLFAFVLDIGIVSAESQQTAQNSSAALKKCVKDSACSTVLDAAYTLARRQEFDFLLRQYSVAENNTQQLLVQAIYASKLGRNNSKVDRFMREVAFSQTPKDRTSDTTWYALQFLADECDQKALVELDTFGGDAQTPYKFQVSCGDWAQTLRTFGACKYTASREVLVNSLNSSCLDVLNAATASLQRLYPGACPKVKTSREVADCYRRSWNE
jgi:hypothetical protein